MNNQIKIAICDDEPVIASLIKKYCLKILNEIEIYPECDTYIDGRFLLKNIECYNIILLDIEMPDLDGFSIAKKIYKNSEEKYIVFLTCHNEWSNRGYKYNAFRYLTKPIDVNEFKECMLSLSGKILFKKKHLINYKGENIIILIDNIIYIESLGDNSLVVDTSNTNSITPYTLKKWITILDPISFSKCHKSYIVNFNYVKNIEKDKIILMDKNSVPLSTRNYQKIKKSFISFLSLYS